MPEKQNGPINPNDQPQHDWASKKHDKVYLAAILAVILIGIGAYWFLKEPQAPVAQNTNNTKTQVPEQQVQEESFELPTTLTISDSETLLKADISEKFLIHALKDKNHVVVYKKDLKTGKQTKMFEYDERSAATFSGNTWESLPPSIDLDSKNRKIVFSDQQGLKSYDLVTKSTTPLIVKIKESNDGNLESPPVWNPPIPHAYSLLRPRWSPDGRYVSFNLTQYEGSAISAYDTTTGKYLPFTIDGRNHGGYEVSISSKWSPVDNAFVEPYGLLVSNPTNPISLEAIGRPHVANNEGHPEFLTASFSSDGKKLAFIYRDNFGDDGQDNKLAIINRDGTGFQILSDKEEKDNSLFAPNGDVYYTINKKGQQVLFKYSMTLKKAEPVLSLPAGVLWDLSTNAHWTKEGYLTIGGSHWPTSEDKSKAVAKFAIIDINKKEAIYSSGKLPYHSQSIKLTEN